VSTHPLESRLVDFVLGLLSPDDETAIRDHIRQCASCESRLRVIVADRESVRSGPVPVLIDDRIELPAAPRRPSVVVRVGLVAALFAVVALGIYTGKNRNAGPPDYWIPVTNETTVVWRAEGDSNRVMDRFEAYQNQDAAAAVDELRALTTQPPRYATCISPAH
jgi:hypothetical protein